MNIETIYLMTGVFFGIAIALTGIQAAREIKRKIIIWAKRQKE